MPAKASVKRPDAMFTGDVCFDEIAKGEEPCRTRVHSVKFALSAHYLPLTTVGQLYT